MTYIFITYEAVELFASDRFLQSSENEAAKRLCDILRLSDVAWDHSRILLHRGEKGIVFYTKDSGYKKGVVFDLTTFHAFTEEQDDRTVINIFQKTIKYGVRYFDNLPLASCERAFPDKPITIIYPNPFVANHGVPKIVIDRNTSKYQRKDCNYLTVYDYSTDGKSKVSFTSLNKAFEEVRKLNFNTLAENKVPKNSSVRGFSTTELEFRDLTLDANIGYDAWLNYYLTDKQKEFVCSDINGPERLEGAAGTGKTLSLILRCIFLLKNNIETDSEYHMIFFTHSLSTKERIISIFRSNWEDYLLCEENNKNGRSKQSIKVTTLQEWSAEHLGTNSISENEYLDKDAANSKLLQIYYIEDAYTKIKRDLWDNVFSSICSDRFKGFIEHNSTENLYELLRQEIAVLIKGRASSDFDIYKSIARPKYSLPLVEDADYRFVFAIYKQYQLSLEKVGQYDSDDITLTALGQVRTPIWNRRRIQAGYDACVIDETHLFNINELSVFHYVNKPILEGNNTPQPKIIFAIDKSQAIGDWGVDDVSINAALQFVGETENKQFNTVFRSSPDIVNLAYSILSSGVTMFTNFENPLSYSSIDFVKEEEAKCVPPEYTLVNDDETSIIQSVEWAEHYCSEKRVSKNRVLIIATNDYLVNEITNYLQDHNKPFECLQSRSDEQAMRSAINGNKFVISQIDYVGGLEFDAIVLIGVDEGRVPPSRTDKSEAYHVISYAWYSKMYVAVTRAKYAVKIFGDISRGPSFLLYSSILNGTIIYSGPSLLRD